MRTKIIDYGMNGEGVAKIEGKIFLIDFALIDEEVEVETTLEKENMGYAKLTKIITPSQNRTNPPCPYFKVCGGCDLQHMNYDEQLKFKTNLIHKTIKKICKLETNVENTISCNNHFEYRNKLSLNYNNDKLGFYKKNSKEIVEIDSCLLATKNINKILKIFKNFIKNNEKNKNFIKNLVIREIFSQILVGVVTSKQIDLTEFFNTLKNEFSLIGLYQIINTRKDSVVLSGKTIYIAGIKNINIENFSIKYSIDLLSFHQTNIDIQNKLYKTVLDLIPSNSNVVNGFSGQGLLSAIISQKANSVVGIEIVKESHLIAEKLKKDNNLTNVTNVLGDFNKHIDKYKNYDYLIIDPAKRGCGKEIMEKVIGFKNIIYVSCNPIAMCKDLNIIKDQYEIKKIIPFDMFPNTKNVETLMLLTKI